MEYWFVNLAKKTYNKVVDFECVFPQKHSFIVKNIKENILSSIFMKSDQFSQSHTCAKDHANV